MSTIKGDEDGTEVKVLHVSIPAFSTIGYGRGETREGKEVSFVGDHRPMRHIGEAIAQGEETWVTVPDYAMT